MPPSEQLAIKAAFLWVAAVDLKHARQAVSEAQQRRAVMSELKSMVRIGAAQDAVDKQLLSSRRVQ